MTSQYCPDIGLFIKRFYFSGIGANAVDLQYLNVKIQSKINSLTKNAA